MIHLQGKTSNHQKEVKMKGDGYHVRGGILYVEGIVKGIRYRKSTGLAVNPKNIANVAKNHKRILESIINEKQSTSFSAFGLEVIKCGSSSRGIPYQKELESKFKREVEPFFKHMEFDEIKPLTIEKWKNSLLMRYDQNTVRKYLNMLKSIMTKAIANDLCLKNPFDGVEKVKSAKSKKSAIYTQDEMAKMLAHADGWLKHFLMTAFGTGMRVGELLALKWSDINFEKNSILVARSMSHGVIGPTKTKTICTIDMLSMVKNSLLALHEKKRCEWVFPNKDNVPYTESKNILKYYFKPLLKRLGIEYKQLRVSRHGFVSLMLNNGMDLLWVSKTARHASYTTTLKHYAMYDETNKTRLEQANCILNNGTLVAHKESC